MRAEQGLYRSGNTCYRFGDFTIDGSKFCLYRGGFHQPLGRRAFDVLFYLNEHRDRVVEKKELLKKVGELVKDGLKALQGDQTLEGTKKLEEARRSLPVVQ